MPCRCDNCDWMDNVGRYERFQGEGGPGAARCDESYLIDLWDFLRERHPEVAHRIEHEFIAHIRSTCPPEADPLGPASVSVCGQSSEVQ